MHASTCIPYSYCRLRNEDLGVETKNLKALHFCCRNCFAPKNFIYRIFILNVANILITFAGEDKPQVVQPWYGIVWYGMVWYAILVWCGILVWYAIFVWYGILVWYAILE